jgi:hypothetical protein
MNIHKSSSASGREKVSSELMMRHHNDSQRCWVSNSLTQLSAASFSPAKAFCDEMSLYANTLALLM